jgi:mono/diheme cytochrome c family protein
MKFFCSLTLILGAFLGQTSFAQGNELTTKVKALLTDRCSRCHGPESRGAGGIDYIDNLEMLVAEGKIIPNDPEGSIIIERVTTDDPEKRMPRGQNAQPLSEEEVALIVEWINAGAPAQ